jgi:hypothetical protein
MSRTVGLEVKDKKKTSGKKDEGKQQANDADSKEKQEN